MEKFKDVLRNECNSTEAYDSFSQTSSVALEKKLESFGALSAISSIRKSSLFLNKRCAFTI